MAPSTSEFDKKEEKEAAHLVQYEASYNLAKRVCGRSRKNACAWWRRWATVESGEPNVMDGCMLDCLCTVIVVYYPALNLPDVST